MVGVLGPGEGPEVKGDGGITVELGTIVGSGEPLSWRISVTGSPHLFILGIPGQGKS